MTTPPGVKPGRPPSSDSDPACSANPEIRTPGRDRRVRRLAVLLPPCSCRPHSPWIVSLPLPLRPSCLRLTGTASGHTHAMHIHTCTCTHAHTHADTHAVAGTLSIFSLTAFCQDLTDSDSAFLFTLQDSPRLKLDFPRNHSNPFSFPLLLPSVPFVVSLICSFSPKHSLPKP